MNIGALKRFQKHFLETYGDPSPEFMEAWNAAEKKFMESRGLLTPTRCGGDKQDISAPLDVRS